MVEILLAGPTLRNLQSEARTARRGQTIMGARYPSRMRIPISGILIAVSFFAALPDRATAQSIGVSALLNACQRGNMSACNAIAPLIGNACRQGQQQACALQRSIRSNRLNGHSAEAMNARTLHRRCFSGDAAACKRLQEGPQHDTTVERRPDLPGLSR